MLELQKDFCWPESIFVNVNVGTDTYLDDWGNPCCAVGCAAREFDTSFTSVKLVHWRLVYIELYRALYNPPDNKALTVETTNDEIDDDKERTNLYLLTWAKLGYTKGMPKRILNRLKLSKVKKIKIKWR